MKRSDITELHYIAPIENVPSILWGEEGQAFIFHLARGKQKTETSSQKSEDKQEKGKRAYSVRSSMRTPFPSRRLFLAVVIRVRNFGSFSNR